MSYPRRFLITIVSAALLSVVLAAVYWRHRVFMQVESRRQGESRTIHLVAMKQPRGDKVYLLMEVGDDIQQRGDAEGYVTVVDALRACRELFPLARFEVPQFPRDSQRDLRSLNDNEVLALDLALKGYPTKKE